MCKHGVFLVEQFVSAKSEKSTCTNMVKFYLSVYQEKMAHFSALINAGRQACTTATIERAS